MRLMQVLACILAIIVKYKETLRISRKIFAPLWLLGCRLLRQILGQILGASCLSGVGNEVS